MYLTTVDHCSLRLEVPVKRERISERIGHKGGGGEALKASVGQPEEKRPLGGTRSKSQNMKQRFKTAYKNVNWIRLAQDRDKWLAHVKLIVNHWDPLTIGGCLVNWLVDWLER
jgi:hypothetical protein